ncbi:MAG: hypothetical protein J0L92_15565 [Deltaproteobacteria bacterium]|nr:hypothetical protein [Deltaproteobacteria bacterium]
MRRSGVACLLVLAACGAKSGLVVPEPVPIDANVDAFVVPPDAFTFDAGPIVVVPELIVVATADNSYRFGFGDARGLRSTFGAAEAVTACEIFCCSAMCTSDRDCPGVPCGPLGACEDDLGAEIYRVPEGAVTGSDFLYVLGWSDDSVTQGLLVEVRDARGETLLLSGEEGWEVCATRRDFDTGSGGPSDDEVATWLERCERDAGWLTSDGSTSGPGLSVGETNDAEGGDFPPVCGARTADTISPRARWMWFDDDRSDGRSAFTTPQSEFQIFRISTRAIVSR